MGSGTQPLCMTPFDKSFAFVFCSCINTCLPHPILYSASNFCFWIILSLFCVVRLFFPPTGFSFMSLKFGYCFGNLPSQCLGPLKPNLTVEGVCHNISIFFKYSHVHRL